MVERMTPVRTTVAQMFCVHRDVILVGKGHLWHLSARGGGGGTVTKLDLLLTFGHRI